MARMSAVSMAVAMVVVAVAMAALVPSATAAPCANIRTMLPCLKAARDGVYPDNPCCQAVANFAQGGSKVGIDCLCGAISDPTAKSVGMKPDYALRIPQKCNLKYKAGQTCNGYAIPGGQ